MIEWHINQESGCISELLVDGVNVIYPWGFETSDSYSFFSQETGGTGCVRSNFETHSINGEISTQFDVKMQEGYWHLDIQEYLRDNVINRTHKLTTLLPTYMFDFVSRFRFKKHYFQQAVIAGKVISHANSNVYYQFPVASAELLGHDFNVSFGIDYEESDWFRPHMYVRDFRDEWVIHARLMPKKWDKEVMKLCVKWYNRALPQRFTDTLLSLPFVKSQTWLRGERKPYRFPMTLLSPNTYPELKLPQQATISMESWCRIDK